MNHERKIAVVGLGYVGLPVAVAFGRTQEVVAFDINATRIAQLKEGVDRTNEVSSGDLKASDLRLTDDPAALRDADFVIVTVPTPINHSRRPDLGSLLSATATVGRNLVRGTIVVFESTVYPGLTEQECVPVLERESGLTCGSDFFVGYSPERINPGDDEHRFASIKKVVAGQDTATLDMVACVYESVVTAGVHRAADIKTAEAAKVIENTQRDLNIALMNELAVICHRLNIDVGDVLDAAGTKWNFLPFKPGLVGGHCIGVDPYYLTHRAEQVGYHPEVILAGRRINDEMGSFIAQEMVKLLLQTQPGRSHRVAVLGITFKPNVPDVRNSKVLDVVRELQTFGVEVLVHDPLADAAEVEHEFGIHLCNQAAIRNVSGVVLAVSHQSYRESGWGFVAELLENGNGVVVDVQRVLDRSEKPEVITLWRL